MSAGRRKLRAALQLCVCVGLAFQAGWSIAGDFDDGLAAYKSGAYEKAVPFLRRAAEHGDARAQAGLGLMYGQGQGVARDEARALGFFRDAAAQHHPIAEYSLGFAYANGRGVAVDLVRAKEWYERAAAQGLAGAQMNLGALYFNGSGVARDDVQADKWFTLAADKGVAEAAAARNAVEARMTPEQRDQAQRLVAAWKKAHR